MIRRIVRVALSVAIFAIVLHTVGAGDVFGQVSTISPAYLAVALSMVLFDSFLRATNWYQLLRRVEPLRLRLVWLTYLTGGFYGSLIPSTVGTDAARAVTLRRRASIDLRIAAGSLVTLNLLGLGAVAVVGVVAAAALSAREPSAFLAFGATVGVCLALAVFLLLFTSFGRRLLQLLRRLTESWPRAQRSLEPLFHALFALPGEGSQRLSLVATALLNQVIRISVGVVAATSLGLDLDWWVFAVVAPMVAVTSMIPLSILGLGIEQGAMVLLLGQFGIAGSDAFSISLVVASVYVGLALAGGLVVILEAVFGTEAAGSVDLPRL